MGSSGFGSGWVDTGFGAGGGGGVGAESVDFIGSSLF